MTIAAIPTVRPMIDRYVPVSSWRKLASVQVCSRVFVNGLTVQNAVISISTSDAR